MKSMARPLLEEGGGDVHPVPARLNDAKVGKEIGKNAHPVVFRATLVVDRDLADGLLRPNRGKVAALVAQIGSGYKIDEGVRFLFVIGTFGRAEKGVCLAQSPHGVQGGGNALGRDAVATECLAAPPHDGSVFCHDEDLVGDGFKHLFQRHHLPPARRAEQNAARVEFFDGFKDSLRQSACRVEQCSVEIACDQSDHRSSVFSGRKKQGAAR